MASLRRLPIACPLSIGFAALFRLSHSSSKTICASRAVLWPVFFSGFCCWGERLRGRWLFSPGLRWRGNLFVHKAQKKINLRTEKIFGLFWWAFLTKLRRVCGPGCTRQKSPMVWLRACVQGKNLCYTWKNDWAKSI